MKKTLNFIILLAILLTSRVTAQSPSNDGLQAIDSVKSGTSMLLRIKEAILFTESYIIEKIGRDNFYNNYKFDSVFNDVLWATLENGNYSKHSRSIKSDNSYANSIEEFSNDLRLIYHYNFSYKNIEYPERGFSLHVQLAGDKSTINVQGLIKLTNEKNLTNILTKDEVLERIRRTKFKKEIRKSIEKNISTNRIAHDYENIKGEPFGKIYYTILLSDIKEPAYYKFDPWTGELCCIIKTQVK